MSNVTFLDGITQHKIATDRLEVAYLEAGTSSATDTVVLVHGNVSCSWFFQELMLALVDGGDCRVLAPDLRGYGDTQTLPVDATRGLQDFSEDLQSWADALNLPKFHLLGWSLGGNIAIQWALANPAALRSLVLEAAGAPYGFGGTHGLKGMPNHPDYAGSGGGTANPEFANLIATGASGSDTPMMPRNVMNAFYFKPPFKASPALEEVYVAAMLSTVVGDQNYPGNLEPSENWPNVAPGRTGVNNALSPKYLTQAGFVSINPQPPVLWVRGDSDQIVADNSLFDLGVLGQLGAVPGYPGVEVYPPQPMVSQLRTLLEAYAEAGGEFREVVLADCGHSPHIEKADEFSQLLLNFIAST